MLMPEIAMAPKMQNLEEATAKVRSRNWLVA
jgi:hypothetical protein